MCKRLITAVFGDLDQDMGSRYKVFFSVFPLLLNVLLCLYLFRNKIF